MKNIIDFQRELLRITEISEGIMSQNETRIIRHACVFTLFNVVGHVQLPKAFNIIL